MVKIYSNNPYLQSLAEKVAEQKTDSDIAEWVCNHTTLGGKPFSFKDHLYQKELINDMHPNMCCKKLSQVGMTEIQIRKVLAFMYMNPGTRVIYTFPNTILKENNSKTRIRPTVDTDFPDKGQDAERGVRNNDLTENRKQIV